MSRRTAKRHHFYDRRRRGRVIQRTALQNLTGWLQRNYASIFERHVRLSQEGEAALRAGLPVGSDGQPADPEKFGVISIDARVG